MIGTSDIKAGVWLILQAKYNQNSDIKSFK